MLTYQKPAITDRGVLFFALTQATNGEPLIPLDCTGSVSNCDVGTLGFNDGFNTCCTSDVIRFLIPGADCDAINPSTDCNISVESGNTCNNFIIDEVQCSQGCVVTFQCNDQVTCGDPQQYSVSCDGYEGCTTNSASNNC